MVAGLAGVNRSSRKGLFFGNPNSQNDTRWTLIQGSSRRHLPKLLANLGKIGLFIHDSLHTERNVSIEMALGALVVDDVDADRGFEDFMR